MERLCVHTATQQLLLALVHHVYPPSPPPTTELEGGQQKVTPLKMERGQRMATAYLSYLRQIITEKQQSAALWARTNLQPHQGAKPGPQHLHAVKRRSLIFPPPPVSKRKRPVQLTINRLPRRIIPRESTKPLTPGRARRGRRYFYYPETL